MSKLGEATGPDYTYYHFRCPGCKSFHTVRVGKPPGKPPGWGFNGDMDKPTFTPSVLANKGRLNPGRPTCHSFVREGKIQYLNDCTHDLAGQTVKIPDWDLDTALAERD